LANSTKEAQVRAEASFKRKELQARDGMLAINEYNAAGNAMREKTARLKAMRLAKEAADLEAAANAPKIVPKAKAAPKATSAKKK
jgi:hypothetical protein